MMPKITGKRKSKPKGSCKACEGSGKSSSGGQCWACGGTGNERPGHFAAGMTKQKIWECPDCGKIHRGFKKNICRNKECRSYGL